MIDAFIALTILSAASLIILALAAGEDDSIGVRVALAVFFICAASTIVLCMMQINDKDIQTRRITQEAFKHDRGY